MCPLFLQQALNAFSLSVSGPSRNMTRDMVIMMGHFIT